MGPCRGFIKFQDRSINSHIEALAELFRLVWLFVGLSKKNKKWKWSWSRFPFTPKWVQVFPKQEFFLSVMYPNITLPNLT